MKRADKQAEVVVIEKVFDFITYTFPKEMKKAAKEFRKSPEAEAAQDERSYSRGFISWFLLEREINLGLTPMELAYHFPLDFFTAQDRKIIKNFTEHVLSLFEVKKIDKKCFLLKNVVDSKEYAVKTIDFPDVLEESDYIRALIVKKLEGHYFFYGNVWTYTKEEGLNMKDYLLDNIKKKRKIQKPEIEWEIEYKK